MLALSATVAISTHAQPAGNRDVVKLNPPQPVENDGKIEVLEFFAYGCPHCAALEPKLEAWAKKLPADVKIRRVPGAPALRGIDNASLFYTLEAMGLQEKMQQKIFDAANVQNVILGNPATLNSWLEKQGVDIKKFAEIQKSFSIQNKMSRAKAMYVDYKIGSVPTSVPALSWIDTLVAPVKVLEIILICCCIVLTGLEIESCSKSMIFNCSMSFTASFVMSSVKTNLLIRTLPL